MEDVIVTIKSEKIKEALEKAADEVFKNSYSNPLTDLMKKCISEKQGDVEKIVNEIIVDAISAPEFKAKMANIVIQKMVESVLKK